jgi:hypothetical protein
LVALLQYRDLAGAVHNRQFIGKAFFLSDRDYVRIPGQGDHDSEVIPISIPKLI